MFSGGICEDDNWPLLAVGAGEASYISVKVRSPAAGVKPQTVTTNCPVYWWCTEIW